MISTQIMVDISGSLQYVNVSSSDTNIPFILHWDDVRKIEKSCNKGNKKGELMGCKVKQGTINVKWEVDNQ